MKRLLLVISALGFVGLTTPAIAQSAAERAGIVRTNLVSSNPIGLLFQWYNGEYEHSLQSTTSLAVAATRFDVDDFNYNAVDGIVRYYPGGHAIRGFSVGASAGFIYVSEDNCTDCENGTGATVGVRGDYVWILGRDQRFAAAAGIGAKRVFASNVGSAGLPIARLSIGWAW